MFPDCRINVSGTSRETEDRVLDADSAPLLQSERMNHIRPNPPSNAQGEECGQHRLGWLRDKVNRYLATFADTIARIRRAIGIRTTKLKLYTIDVITKLMLEVITGFNRLFAGRSQERSDSDSDPEIAPLLEREGGLVAGGDRFRHIVKEYSLGNGESIATQTLDRQPVKDTHLHMIQARAAVLEERLRQYQLRNESMERMTPVMQELQWCRQELAAVELMKRDYISTSYVRDMLEADRTENYCVEVRNICCGAPTNQRYNQVEIEGNVVGGHCDLGVITFAPNGLTNLGELKEARDDPAKLVQLRNRLQALSNHIASGPETFENKKKLQAIDYAIKQVADEASLDHAIAERRFHLQNQFLHLLMVHVKNRGDTISADEPFTIAQISLLNPSKSDLNGTGWTHNEKNEFLDMKEIFKEFDGAHVACDGNAAHIAEDGTVHLPFRHHIPAFSLNTVCINISVQGSTSRNDLQLKWNKEDSYKLLEASSEIIKRHDRSDEKRSIALLEAQALLISAHQRMLRGESSYAVAEDYGYALTRLGISTGINCLSAKDRTGYVSTRVILRHVIAHLQALVEQGQLTPKEFEHLKADYEKSIVSKNSCPAQNIYDNTGTHVLKCSAYKLPGYTTDNARGHARRLGYFIAQGGLIAESKVLTARTVNQHAWEELHRTQTAAAA